MKQILTFLVTALLSSSAFPQIPSWYGNISPKSGEIIGFGEGTTLDEAKNKAHSSIATSVKARIKGQFKYKETYKGEKTLIEAEDLIQTTTDIILTDVKLNKKTRIDNMWYVALSYYHLPFEKKFAKKLKPFHCKNEKQNRYLKDTPLVRLITQELRCKINLRLIRKSNLWYIAYRNVMLPLTALDLEKLFVDYQSRKLSITSSKSQLMASESFSFKIKSKRSGYITLFNVYEDGQVFTLLKNREVRANKTVQFPGPNTEFKLVANTLYPGKPTYELYVVVFSKKKLQVGRFQDVGSELTQGEIHYKFAELIDTLDTSDFSVSLIRIKPQ